MTDPYRYWSSSWGLRIAWLFWIEPWTWKEPTSSSMTTSLKLCTRVGNNLSQRWKLSESMGTLLTSKTIGSLSNLASFPPRNDRAKPQVRIQPNITHTHTYLFFLIIISISDKLPRKGLRIVHINICSLKKRLMKSITCLHRISFIYRQSMKLS